MPGSEAVSAAKSPTSAPRRPPCRGRGRRPAGVKVSPSSHAPPSEAHTAWYRRPVRPPGRQVGEAQRAEHVPGADVHQRNDDQVLPLAARYRQRQPKEAGDGHQDQAATGNATARNAHGDISFRTIFMAGQARPQARVTTASRTRPSRGSPPVPAAADAVRPCAGHGPAALRTAARYPRESRPGLLVTSLTQVSTKLRPFGLA